MLDRLHSCLKKMHRKHTASMTVWKLARQGQRPPNSLWKDAVETEPRCVPILFAIGVVFSLVMAFLAFLLMSRLVSPQTHSSPPIGANAPTIAAATVFGATISFMVYSSVRMLRPTRRRRAAMLRRSRRMLLIYVARSNGQPSTRLERLLVANASDDFGSALRILGWVIKGSLLLYIPLLLVMILIVFTNGPNAVPSWLIAPLRLLAPQGATPILFILYSIIIPTAIMYLGRRVNHIGRMITQRGRATDPLREVR